MTEAPIVDEVHVAIENERSQVGIVLNAVAVDDAPVRAGEQRLRRQIRNREEDADGDDRATRMTIETIQTKVGSHAQMSLGTTVIIAHRFPRGTLRRACYADARSALCRTARGTASAAPASRLMS